MSFPDMNFPDMSFPDMSFPDMSFPDMSFHRPFCGFTQQKPDRSIKYDYALNLLYPNTVSLIQKMGGLQESQIETKWQLKGYICKNGV